MRVRSAGFIRRSFFLVVGAEDGGVQVRTVVEAVIRFADARVKLLVGVAALRTAIRGRLVWVICRKSGGRLEGQVSALFEFIVELLLR